MAQSSNTTPTTQAELFPIEQPGSCSRPVSRCLSYGDRIDLSTGYIPMQLGQYPAHLHGGDIWNARPLYLASCMALVQCCNQPTSSRCRQECPSVRRPGGCQVVSYATYTVCMSVSIVSMDGCTYVRTHLLVRNSNVCHRGHKEPADRSPFLPAGCHLPSDQARSSMARARLAGFYSMSAGVPEAKG